MWNIVNYWIQDFFTARCTLIQANNCKNIYFDGGCISLPVIIVFNDPHSMKKPCVVIEGCGAQEKLNKFIWNWYSGMFTDIWCHCIDSIFQVRIRITFIGQVSLHKQGIWLRVKWLSVYLHKIYTTQHNTTQQHNGLRNIYREEWLYTGAVNCKHNK